jgi:prevent-host-death family protein
MKRFSVSEDIVPLGEFKAGAARILEKLADSRSPLVITQNGRPAGVLLSPKEFDRLCERHSFLESVAAGISDADSDRVMETPELRRRLSERRTERSRK